MDLLNYFLPISSRPTYYSSSEIGFTVPKNLERKNDERVLGAKLVLNRPLFGHCYMKILPSYFNNMPQLSGVFISPLVDIRKIVPSASFPGDIDLLIIPYENQNLILSKTLVVELKAIRASFDKQGKSPNDFGFTQAKALLDLGFPYVAVGHLIVSDNSPREAWRNIMMGKIKDAETGELGELEEVSADMLPVDLMARAYGRMIKNRNDSKIGLFSAYISSTKGMWFPEGSSASWNNKTSKNLLDAIHEYYLSDFDNFFDTPRYNPKP